MGFPSRSVSHVDANGACHGTRREGIHHLRGSTAQGLCGECGTCGVEMKEGKTRQTWVHWSFLDILQEPGMIITTYQLVTHILSQLPKSYLIRKESNIARLVDKLNNLDQMFKIVQAYSSCCFSQLARCCWTGSNHIKPLPGRHRSHEVPPDMVGQ